MLSTLDHNQPYLLSDCLWWPQGGRGEDRHTSFVPHLSIVFHISHRQYLLAQHVQALVAMPFSSSKAQLAAEIDVPNNCLHDIGLLP